MSLRITIPKPILELLKHKYGMDEAQIRQEFVKLVYDLVTGETKSVFWMTSPRQNLAQVGQNQERSQTSSSQTQKTSSYKKIEDIRDLIIRAKRYRDKIIKEQGYITEEQLERVAKKFNIDISYLWDDLIMKEEGKYYPM